MNVAVMDVYSRLMMDRIIFLGYPINDEVANIVTAQLLFLECTDRTRDIRCTLIVRVAVCMQDWVYMTLCSTLARCGNDLHRHGSFHGLRLIVCGN